MPLPRGITNANPGNIRKTATPWLGQTVPGTDASFCQFSDPKYGLRALMVLLRRYYYVLGLQTVEQIINRWAPSTENNTAAYISDVATRMNVPADQPLMICPETYITFAQAITVHENGVPPIIYPVYWYSPEVYQQAYNLTVPSGVQAS